MSIPKKASNPDPDFAVWFLNGVSHLVVVKAIVCCSISKYTSLLMSLARFLFLLFSFLYWLFEEVCSLIISIC